VPPARSLVHRREKNIEIKYVLFGLVIVMLPAPMEDLMIWTIHTHLGDDFYLTKQ
jgi:hypothetical protein